MNTARRVAIMVAIGMALLPALASAKPPEPEGKPVYQDDFSNATKSGLEDNLEGEDFSRGFHTPGVYHLKLANPDEVRWSLLPDQTYGQFSLQADVWDNSDSFQGGVAQGLVFRAKDDTHFYTVLLDPRKGQYAVRKLNGKQWSDLVPMTASPLVKKQAEVNQLRVDAKADKFTVYLNGETLATFSDASYSSGQIGMLVANTDAVDPHLHFDNLKIYTTEAAATLPAALPSTGGDALATLALATLGALLLGSGALTRRL
ncbi:MAG: hypothetical protein RLZZ387_3082, partial [Chloroflexota bacterium]